MNVKEAVTQAKREVIELFAEENLTNIGLEEVELDDKANVWSVTIGFSRPWDEPKNTIAALTGPLTPKRSYKIVKISNDTNKAVSIRNREI